jgi:hypothetical protein
MRFLVVSYSEEEQQVLNDFVEAPNKDAALNLVRRLALTQPWSIHGPLMSWSRLRRE